MLARMAEAVSGETATNTCAIQADVSMNFDALEVGSLGVHKILQVRGFARGDNGFDVSNTCLKRLHAPVQ